ncbi:glycoside hydrolase family 27 protein [Parathielavia hyrcaniae]|uniref:Alpha-galactosidase n=1 Tax=Parathielavia hyrcaniae TaxID=113614 RepID=A0AAN6PX98_9PEZI|nr:glycoside hydrolase family 27 protein [Parathielavia hyrcaniae]
MAMESRSATLQSFLTLLLTLSGFHLAESSGTNLGLTPHMGWSTWNVAQCRAASARYALDAAEKFISLGLKDLGYEYINIDDCWSTRKRGASGKLAPDPVKWPDGIKAVADQIHDMGLKFGLYGCAGQMTCAGFPGSEGHAASDVDQLVGWGVDFWKFDNCYTPCKVNPRPETCPRPAGNSKTWYAPMRDAILTARSARQIHFNLCNWGRDEVWKWGAQYGAQSWRISPDNYGDWASIERIATAAAPISQHSGPGGFNDLDMLYLGSPKLNAHQERLHFGLWGMLKSPLVLGLDLGNISASTLETLTNRGVIAVNQDPLGRAAAMFRPPGAPEPEPGRIYPYWAGELVDGVVIGLCAGMVAGRYGVEFRDVPGLGRKSYEWKEMYTGQTGRGSGVAFDIGLHDMRVVKVAVPGAREGHVGL